MCVCGVYVERELSGACESPFAASSAGSTDFQGSHHASLEYAGSSNHDSAVAVDSQTSARLARTACAWIPHPLTTGMSLSGAVPLITFVILCRSDSGVCGGGDL